MLTLGSMLQDRYRIENVLGKGGMGSVYLATHVHLEREVAVKQLYLRTNDAETDAAALRQFKHEAVLLESLHHPRLPAVYDYIEVEGTPYLIMEYVRGRSLGSILESGVRQTESQVRRWAEALCEVLGYLHSRTPAIIFRDMKPSNIMVDTTGQIKLIDFGIAKIFDPSSVTKTFARGAGSPGYSSPEQYSGTTDARSDIYSLGATLYALLTNRVPPPSVELAAGLVDLQPIPILRSDVSSDFAEAIHWCLQIRSNDRPQSVEEAAQALARGRPRPQAQPSVSKRDFATTDDKNLSLEDTVPLPPPTSLPTAMAGTGATDTERLKNQVHRPATKKRTPVAPTLPNPPNTPATDEPRMSVVAADPDAMTRTRTRAGLVAGAAVVLLGVVAWRMFDTPTNFENPLPPPPPSPVARQSDGPASAPTSGDVRFADDSSLFQYEGVVRTISQLKGYTVQCTVSGPAGETVYGYRCLAPDQVRAEILQGAGRGAVYVDGHLRRGTADATDELLSKSVFQIALDRVHNTTGHTGGRVAVNQRECIELVFSNGDSWDIEKTARRLVRFKTRNVTYTLSHLVPNPHPIISL